MKASILVTGPYVNMLFDGMFVPEEQGGGTFAGNISSKCAQLLQVLRAVRGD